MKLTSNLIKYYLWQFISGFYFIYTLQALYLLSKGITPTQLALFASVTAISSTALEIPTGFIADKFSRKLSVSLGFFCSGLAYLGFIFITNFYGLLIISFLLGLAEALKSGAEESLIYDDLKSLNQESDYLKVTSKGTTIGTISGAMATFLGPILYVIHATIPFVLSSITHLLLGVLILSFTESRNSFEVKEEVKVMGGVMAILKNKYVRLIVLTDTTLLVFVNIYYQVLFFPKINSLGLGVQYLGTLDVINILLMSGMFIILPRLVLKNEKNNLILYTILPVLFFILFGLSNKLIPALIFGVVFDLVWSARKHILPTITNRHFNSNDRALSISSMSFISNLGAAIFVPIALILFNISYYYTLIPAIFIVFLLYIYPKSQNS